MYLYLRSEGRIVRAPIVTLKDCLRPTVGQYVEARIEPALWYKVLILDSIFIDCDHRAIHCSCDSDENARALHSLEPAALTLEVVAEFFSDKDYTFGDGHFYDFDPNVDDLFETSRNIVIHLRCVDNEDMIICEEILKLIHVFVLPDIRFLLKHRHVLLKAKTEIEMYHVDVEKTIKHTDDTKRNLEKALRRRREQILKTGQFDSQKYVSTLNNDFLQILLKHICKDIILWNEYLEVKQKEIQQLRDSANETDIHVLSKARSEREIVVKAVNWSIIAREEIKNVLGRSHVKRKFRRQISRLSDEHSAYMNETKSIDKLNGSIRDLIYSKIKISSVREAVLLTIQEVDSDGKSYGFNIKKSAFENETDFFDSRASKLPKDWTTLDEQVKDVLNKVSLKSKYTTFCERIKDQCRRLGKDKELFAGRPSFLEPLTKSMEELITRTGNSSVDRRASKSRNGSCKPSPEIIGVEKRKQSFSSTWSMGSISKTDCQRICKDISNHIMEMAEEISKEFPHSQQNNFVNKVYVCYEQNLADELMRDMCDVYEQSYKAQCFSLADWLKRNSVSVGNLEEEILRKFTCSSLDYDDDDDEDEIAAGEKGNTRRMAKPTEDTTDAKLQCEQHEDLVQSLIRILDVSMKEAEQERGVCGPQTDEIMSQYLEPSIASSNGVPNNGCARGEENAALSENDCLETHTYVNELDLLRREFYTIFKHFYEIVDEEQVAVSYFSKLRTFTRAVKCIEEQISKHQTTTTDLCADDLLDVLILLLRKLEPQKFLQLYAHLNLLIHLSPQFMQGNAHDYSLVTISVAYQYLFEQQLLNKTPKS
ncbi:uncharacterized protein LOC127838846 [Dreissena polymorpha]|uniref:VPS9 domain-containing protein n=1 Tax=Dreissena polymorpha TaxID=45954 RepID=A0A9D4F8K4_DREPO|nr:uncharacterized protein LOC127838846 [Dreissena polymorpha]KAH3794063.1 hypothetical protein DPMN_147594 [Dreissena polymorpha]